MCDLYLFQGAPDTTAMAMTVNPDVVLSAPDTVHIEGLYAFRLDLNARSDRYSKGSPQMKCSSAPPDIRFCSAAGRFSGEDRCEEPIKKSFTSTLQAWLRALGDLGHRGNPAADPTKIETCVGLAPS